MKITSSMAQFLQAERSAEPTSDGGGAKVEPNGGEWGPAVFVA